MIFRCEVYAMKKFKDINQGIKEAMKATRINTKTKVIITALEELIRKSKISELKKFKGKVDLNIDMDTIRGRQCRY